MQVTEGLYQLDRHGESHAFDVVFFHGFQRQSDYSDAWWNTWYTAPSSFWPAHAIATEFPEARILFASYDSSDQGGQDIVTIANALFGATVVDPGNVGQKRSVVLIGHSMGGLAIKALCRHALDVATDTGSRHTDAAKEFLRNLRLVAYIATPHTGARLADLRCLLPPRQSGLAAILTTLNKEVGRLNVRFAALEQMCNFRQIAFFETKKLQLFGPVHSIVVSEASATAYCKEVVACPGADHLSIARPIDMQASRMVAEMKAAMRSALKPQNVICTRRYGPGIICGNVLYSEEALMHDGEHSWQLEGSQFERARLITGFQEGAVRLGDAIIPYCAKQGYLRFRKVSCSRCQNYLGWYVHDLDCELRDKYQIGKYGVVDKYTEKVR